MPERRAREDTARTPTPAGAVACAAAPPQPPTKRKRSVSVNDLARGGLLGGLVPRPSFKNAAAETQSSHRHDQLPTKKAAPRGLDLCASGSANPWCRQWVPVRWCGPPRLLRLQEDATTKRGALCIHRHGRYSIASAGTDVPGPIFIKLTTIRGGKDFIPISSHQRCTRPITAIPTRSPSTRGKRYEKQKWTMAHSSRGPTRTTMKHWVALGRWLELSWPHCK